MSEKQLTKPGVFIIESLSFADEQHKRFEGQLIANILDLNLIPSKYYYIRTKRELNEVLDLFDASNYRYLHISCHGSNTHLNLTLDDLTFQEIGGILRGHLAKRRLFLSACQATSTNLIKTIIPQSACYSVIGPVNNIQFRDAAISWAAFYHLMFKSDPKIMKRELLIKNLQKVVNTFEEPLNYFSNSSHNAKGYKKKLIRVQKLKYQSAGEETNDSL
jgi:hypothetical protein